MELLENSVLDSCLSSSTVTQQLLSLGLFEICGWVVPITSKSTLCHTVPNGPVMHMCGTMYNVYQLGAILMRRGPLTSEPVCLSNSGAGRKSRGNILSAAHKGKPQDVLISRAGV